MPRNSILSLMAKNPLGKTQRTSFEATEETHSPHVDAAAFVGGRAFDLMPAPLAKVDTQICWPDKQLGGVDLSVLRRVISSGGVALQPNLAAHKAFWQWADFVDHGTHESWRNALGVASQRTAS